MDSLKDRFYCISVNKLISVVLSQKMNKMEIQNMIFQKLNQPANEILICTFIYYHTHIGKAAIQNINTTDKSRSKITRNRVLDCHLSPVR